MEKYIISYLPVDDMIRELPDRLHDLCWVKDYLAAKPAYAHRNVVHYSLIMACKYYQSKESMKCPRCYADIDDSDWEYCPWCGSELNADIDLFAKDEMEIMRQYRAQTGDNMPPEEQEKIRRSVYLKLWESNE